MAAVNKKLDLLLQVILPSGVKSTVEMYSCKPQKADVACGEPEHVGGNDHGERANIITITIAGHERTCSTSLMADNLGKMFPETLIHGKCLEIPSYEIILQ